MATQPRQFRLADETLAELDRIAAHLSEQGHPASRADAIRVSAKAMAKGLKTKGKKNLKKSDKSTE